jgi:hypothetical protein
MSIIYDSFGNEIKKLDVIGGESLTDPRPSTLVIAALNGEVSFDCANTGSVAVDVRGTFNMTMIVQYSIDGVNYNQIPVFVSTTELWQVNITAPGSFIGHLPSAAKRVRILCTAFTSGSASVALRGSDGDNVIYSKPIPTTSAATNTGAAGAAVTLNIAAPGNGLFHYITRLIIQRFAAAAMTAAAAPVLVTTTNLPGSRVFSIPADAALQGTIYSEILEPCQPIKSSAANTATTIVCPATPNAIWSVTADFYVCA